MKPSRAAAGESDGAGGGVDLADVQKTFDAWAPAYNPTHGWTLPRRRAARLALGLQPGDRVLDLACGTGLNFPHLRQLVGERGQVTGVDLSPRMLDVARSLIARRGGGNVQVRQADAAQLPFADETFDKALCSFAMNIIPDYMRAIREVRRVLVPTGRFVSLEVRPILHSLPYLWRVCAVDMSHDVLGGLREVFDEVQVSRAWLGVILIAVCFRPAPMRRDLEAKP
jgi:ubiquinone/menaquinone biosynthesis C-methylase UbiE